jgi:hypothetical protein
MAKEFNVTGTCFSRLHGYLVIFNQNKKKTWKTEWIELKGKKVFAVWV